MPLLVIVEQLMLYNNSFEGNLPDTLINVANLTRVNLSKNRLNGIMVALVHCLMSQTMHLTMRFLPNWEIHLFLRG
jgi:hypothetical protein